MSVQIAGLPVRADFAGLLSRPSIRIPRELLNNLAASIVLEARRNQKGLGSLEERRLLSGEYVFRELDLHQVEHRPVATG